LKVTTGFYRSWHETERPSTLSPRFLKIYSTQTPTTRVIETQVHGEVVAPRAGRRVEERELKTMRYQKCEGIHFENIKVLL
jgi:hypothetical protein